MGNSVSCTPDGFSACLMDMVTEAGKDFAKKADKAVTKAGRVTKTQLNSTSPTMTGRYAAGWHMKAKKEYQSKSVTVYQAKVPGLPHLLEKGHGGPKPAGAIPHIEPAFEAGKAAMMAALK